MLTWLSPVSVHTYSWSGVAASLHACAYKYILQCEDGEVFREGSCLTLSLSHPSNLPCHVEHVDGVVERQLLTVIPLKNQIWIRPLCVCVCLSLKRSVDLIAPFHSRGPWAHHPDHRETVCGTPASEQSLVSDHRPRLFFVVFLSLACLHGYLH